MLLAASALAGPEQIIKQRAKELRDQNNVRQGVPPPARPAQPAQATVSPATAAQQQLLIRLQTDMASIRTNPATPEQKRKLAQDLMALAQGPAKPTLAAADKLANDLAAALAQHPLSAANRARLAQELDAVINPSKYPQAKMQAIFEDVQAIFQASGVARKDAVVIAEDVKALAAAVQKANP